MLTSIDKIIVNSTGLTATSALFNSGHIYSPWVDRIIGFKGSFVDEKFDETTDHFQFYKNFRNYSVAYEDLWSPCSVELLAYARVGISEPIVDHYKKRIPSVGRGSLSFLDQNWTCYYRAVTETWRGGHDYWPVFLYCPAPLKFDHKSCQDIIPHRNIAFSLSISLKSIQWISNFSATLPSRLDREKIKRVKSIYNLHDLKNDGTKQEYKHDYKEPVAVCIIVPYETSQPNKSVAVGAILAEAVRYHSLLDTRVMVYDNDGAHRKYLFDNPYMKAQQFTLDFDYHDYTILGLLDSRRMKYDNAELGQTRDYRLKWGVNDNDKVLSLTHCRFEAKALYGIDHVIVPDPDEFFYCPKGGIAMKAVSDTVHSLMHHYRRAGIEQVQYSMRLLYPTNPIPSDCLITYASQGRSIFDCFTSYKFPIKNHHSKAVHLNYACPLTDYHQSCALTKWNDCICENLYRDTEECSFVHISMRQQYYDDYKSKYNNGKEAFGSKCELGVALQASKQNHSRRHSHNVAHGNKAVIKGN